MSSCKGEGATHHACDCILKRMNLLEAVAESARGFRDYGAAKNGTHAGFLFEALEKLEDFLDVTEAEKVLKINPKFTKLKKVKANLTKRR